MVEKGPQKHQTLTSRTVTAFLWNLGASGAQTILRFVSIVVLARLLTPSQFGVMGAATIVVSLSLLFSEMGMGPAVVQRKTLSELHIRAAFTFSTVVGFGLGIAVYFSAPVIAGFFDFETLEEVLRAVAIVFPLQGIATVAESLLRRDLRFRELSLIKAVSYGFGYVVVAVVLADRGFGVWALVNATIAFTTLKTIGMLAAGHHNMRPVLSARPTRELLSYGGGFTVGRLLNYAARQADYVVAGKSLGDAALGIYNRSYQLLVAPVQLVGQALEQVLFPAMSRRQTRTDLLRTAFTSATSLTAMVFLPLGVLLVIIAPEAVALALGDQWTSATIPFQILAIGMFFRAGYKASDSVANATNAVYRRAWRQGIYAAGVTVGAWVGQDLGDLPGLAAGVLMAVVINFFLMSDLSLRLLNIRWGEYLKLHLQPLRLAALVAMLCLPVSYLSRNAGWPDLGVALSSMGAAAMPFMALLLWPQRFGEDLEGLLRMAIGSRFRADEAERIATPQQDRSVGDDSQ